MTPIRSTLSIADLRRAGACDLDKRITDITAYLGRYPTEDEQIDLRIWLALSGTPDAEDPIDDLCDVALAANVMRWGHIDATEQRRRAEAIAQAGLRYFLLKHSPARTIVFDKQASISLDGDSGPYCQYAYARCTAILGRVGGSLDGVEPEWAALGERHARRVLNALLALPDQHHKAVIELDPSFVARGLYDLAQAFSSFYAAPEGRVVGAAPRVAAARAALVRAAQAVLGANLRLLGITPLDEM